MPSLKKVLQKVPKIVKQDGRRDCQSYQMPNLKRFFDEVANGQSSENKTENRKQDRDAIFSSSDKLYAYEKAKLYPETAYKA